MEWGENASIMHTSLQGQQEIYIDIFSKELSNKVYAWMETEFELDWQKSTGKELFIYLCLNVAKRNETKDKWFLEFPSTSAFVGSVF